LQTASLKKKRGGKRKTESPSCNLMPLTQHARERRKEKRKKEATKRFREEGGEERRNADRSIHTFSYSCRCPALSKRGGKKDKNHPEKEGKKARPDFLSWLVIGEKKERRNSDSCHRKKKKKGDCVFHRHLLACLRFRTCGRQEKRRKER